MPEDQILGVIKVIQQVSGNLGLSFSNKPDLNLADEFVIDLASISPVKLLVVKEHVANQIAKNTAAAAAAAAAVAARSVSNSSNRSNENNQSDEEIDIVGV